MALLWALYSSSRSFMNCGLWTMNYFMNYELATEFQVWSHQCWVAGKDHFPQPAAQDAFSLCSKCTLLAHIQLNVHQDCQVLFCKAAFQQVGPSLYRYTELFLPRCWTLHLPFLNVLKFSIIQTHSTEVGTNDSKTSWCMNHSYQFCIICKLAEDAWSSRSVMKI